MKRENYIRFSYAGHTWMWPVEGEKDDWTFSVPSCSSEDVQSWVLSEEDIEAIDDDSLYFKDGTIAEYKFVWKKK
jgi:hypothetical protein